MAEISVTSVAAVLRRIKGGFTHLGEIRIEAEIHSIKQYPSGHVYFDLKDRTENALLSGVMFRRDVMRLTFSPKMGDAVEMLGMLDVYEPRGQLQFRARTMVPAGEGGLYARFEALKKKLQFEGLFDISLKKELPRYPAAIGVVTSPEAAAFQDVIRTLSRLAPWVPVILYPASVQGDAAEGEILTALESAALRREVDVILLVRGGGSLADLRSFNSETIARKLRQMPVAVVSGVGHESDFTIADMVSDVRAATPTAAASLVAEHWTKAADRIRALERRGQLVAESLLKITRTRVERCSNLTVLLKNTLRNAALRLDMLGSPAKVFETCLDRLSERLDLAESELSRAAAVEISRAGTRLEYSRAKLLRCAPDPSREKMRIAHARDRFVRAFAAENNVRREKICSLSQRLESMNMMKVLSRGYSITTDEQGRIVREASQVSGGDKIVVRFAKGSAAAIIEKVSATDSD